MALEIRQFLCLSDNYGFLIRDRESGRVATIDTPDSARIDEELSREGWRLDMILNTHHHFDHAGGNLALKEKWGCEIVGPRNEAAKIPGIDRALGENDTVELGASKAKVLETPGHTLGHIAYHFAEDGVAFVGDTLFALGCGRLFEGTPAQMWASLSMLTALPPATRLYCAHEYTQANARFALTIERRNAALLARVRQIDRLRSKDAPTVPTTVEAELATNPFVRADETDVKVAVGMPDGDAVEVFAEIRRRKDSFRG
jgi:hydroxyacylglutathione hydrolase